MIKKIIVYLCLIICLTGCVRYDLGVNFTQANSGTIIQHIKLGEQLTSFSEVEANNWLNSIEKRALKLQGKTKRISPEELVVTIPFANGQELTNKFNQFFIPQIDHKSVKKLNKSSVNLLELEAQMSIKQSNLLLLERNVLKFNADLRPLGVISNQGNIIISSGDLINLQLQLNFPWGAKIITNESPKWAESEHNQYNIELEAGQINQVTAIFWLPNYIGLGTMVIILLMVGGFYLKYRKLPLVNRSITSP
jgi:hypothetical protein